MYSATKQAAIVRYTKTSFMTYMPKIIEVFDTVEDAKSHFPQYCSDDAATARMYGIIYRDEYGRISEYIGPAFDIQSQNYNYNGRK